MSQLRNAIALTLSFTSIVWGQSTGTNPASDSAKAPSAAGAQGQVKTLDATRKQALGMLDQLLESALGFGDAEVRIRVQAQVADLLWELDQPRARALITAAFHAITETELPPVDTLRPPSYVGADSHYPLRADLLRMISQRDSQLAVKLVATVVDQPPNIDPKFSGSAYGRYSEQGMLYTQMAGYLAGSDAAGAAQIARTLLERGDIEPALRVLRTIPAANADLARELFVQMLAASRRDKERAGSNMRSLADLVFPRFGEGIIRFTTGDRDQQSTKPLRPELIEPFLEFAYEVIAEQIKSTQASDGGRTLPGPHFTADLTVARLLVRYFEQYLPDKAAILRPRLEEAVRVVNASAQKRGEVGRTAGLLTVQEILEAAETAETQLQRDRIYLDAASRAAAIGETGRANEIADKIVSAQIRSVVALNIRRIEDQKRSQAAQEAIRSGNFENAYRLINETSDFRRRVGELGSLALTLHYKKETARAAQVLSEAERLIPNIESSIDRAQDQLRLAGIAGRLDVNRGFENLKAAVVAINHANFSSRWTKMEGDPGGGGQKNIGLGLLGIQLDAGFDLLSRADFERALQLARNVEMKEASVLGQLAVCRAVLKR